MAFQVVAIFTMFVFYGCYFGKMIEMTMKIATVAVPIIELISIWLNTSCLPIWARYIGMLIAFLGFDLVYIGILIMFFNWGLFILSGFAALMFHLQIVYVEEKFLTVTFGEDYLDYIRGVNRYFGRNKAQ